MGVDFWILKCGESLTNLSRHRVNEGSLLKVSEFPDFCSFCFNKFVLSFYTKNPLVISQLLPVPQFEERFGIPCSCNLTYIHFFVFRSGQGVRGCLVVGLVVGATAAAIIAAAKTSFAGTAQRFREFIIVQYPSLSCENASITQDYTRSNPCSALQYFILYASYA